MRQGWLKALVLAALGVLVAGPAGAADPHDAPPPGGGGVGDMGGEGARAGNLRLPAAVDEATRREFAREYFAAGRSKRPVFERYLDALGVDGMLDFLEAAYPLCHGQAHELGRVIFARLGSLTPALAVCRTRCTSGCMHGILMEVFAGRGEEHVTLGDVQRRMVRLCSEGELARLHKAGNCAHGVGHALMAVAGHDIDRSLTACAAFNESAMEYYCATGIFMEHFEAVGRSDPTGSRGRQPARLHAPCDAYARFPAACYRYQVRRMLVAAGGSQTAVVSECLRLPRRQRLGCFHGLGAAHSERIATTPGLVAEMCRHGTREDQALCIEGAIEKLADVDEAKAVAACTTLRGENARVCAAAAREKMYRLDKPTMKLYSEGSS